MTKYMFNVRFEAFKTLEAVALSWCPDHSNRLVLFPLESKTVNHEPTLVNRVPLILTVLSARTVTRPTLNKKRPIYTI